jgi:hypothetical protein
MVRSNPGLHTGQEEALKPAMAETLDHLGTVTLQVTVVKQPTDLVERPYAGANDKAVYRSRPLQRRVRPHIASRNEPEHHAS